MARVKLSEYTAKSLLVDDYKGIAIHMSSLKDDTKRLEDDQRYIIKVDQGVKKRGKQGLIRLNITKKNVVKAVKELAARGYERFIAEPIIPHEDSEERYLSIERVRGGFEILYSERGGIEVEEHLSDIQRLDLVADVPLPKAFLTHLTATMDREHMSFLEINPLVVRGDQYILLDAAVLVDSAGGWQSSWSEEDIVEAGTKSEAEQVVAELNESSPASFSLRVLNPDGAIWLLLSGGGASITIADEAANCGKAAMIGNYGEYSGGPTREETQIYTEAVLRQMLASDAPKKAIVLAGGVANFTDVRKTFTGVIDALSKHIVALQAEDIKVYVRRGGPNEKEGLALMETYLKQHTILGSIYGSDSVLTTVIDEALERVDA